MTFAQPIFLYSLIILLPVVGLFLWLAARSKANAIARLGNPTLVNRLSANVNRRGRRWKTALWLTALILVVVGLARPQWGEEVEMVEQKGLEVMVALDVSSSMLAQDIKPDRLTRAKIEISDLMDRLGGDEIGLVLFSGAAFIQFPLTSDYNTARMFLDAANPNVISRPGTDIGAAIRTALSGFDFNRASQKVLLLITDGEDHQSAQTLSLAEQAADKGVLIYTIGFGSAQGEPIPEYDIAGNQVGYKTDRNGDVVLSKLDEQTLQELAQIGGGQYYRAGAGGEELSTLLDEINQLQREELATTFERRGIERFQIFIAIAIVLLIVAELIPDRIKVRKPMRLSLSALATTIFR